MRFLCILKCQVLWYLLLTSPFSNGAKEWVLVSAPHCDMGDEGASSSGDPWPGHWGVGVGRRRRRVGRRREESLAYTGREGLSQEKTPNAQRQWWQDHLTCLPLRICHFMNSVSVYTGHVLGSYEMIFEQCRSTLLPKTLIYEMWTHKQMESYYHFAMNEFNFQMDSLGIRRQDYGWFLNSSVWAWTYTLPFVGGNLGQLEASES